MTRPGTSVVGGYASLFLFREVLIFEEMSILWCVYTFLLGDFQ